MQIFETIILGVTQGLTEFIPVSSSGHLVIAQNFFSGASDHLFLEFINFGTFLALLVYFRYKIIEIAKDVFVHKKYRLLVNILLTSIPAGVVGFMMAGFIGSSAFFGNLTVVAVTLAVVGIIMVILEKLPKASAVKDGESLSPLRATIIGLAQVFALIPGVSRSGSTIIAGRLSGLSSKEAAEYSFLASLPIMLGVTLKTFLTDTDYLITNVVPLLVGNLAAFVAGMLAISFLLKYLASHGLAIFGWYRIVLAAIVTVVILVQ
ncbi:undecaprenyl-diphosphate phosphatase [soil metagenome]